jgi:hypothetical protein
LQAGERLHEREVGTVRVNVAEHLAGLGIHDQHHGVPHRF